MSSLLHARRQFKWQYLAQILRWLDADTVQVRVDHGFDPLLSVRTLRLKAYDAPEKDAKDPAEKDLAARATQRAGELAPPGSWVTIETTKTKADGAKMTFARYEAQVFSFTEDGDKFSVATKLAAEGFVKKPVAP